MFPNKLRNENIIPPIQNNATNHPSGASPKVKNINKNTIIKIK